MFLSFNFNEVAGKRAGGKESEIWKEKKIVSPPFSSSKEMGGVLV